MRVFSLLSALDIFPVFACSGFFFLCICFRCLLFAVFVVIVLYLDLLLFAFGKEGLGGGRGKERVDGPPGGGGGGVKEGVLRAMEFSAGQYLPILTNKIYVYPRTRSPSLLKSKHLYTLQSMVCLLNRDCFCPAN
ncbi:hypothetical protein B0T18DRAFT_10353 [Schizothecium vesticola]|uniref:Uncharacterized protein n=1 Tax=Schizothecium vesticola TaxID=314040 RepID=A0AA40KC07_9PEZI|nr:hypothetical protein B0T18DRAFT_10353 [Schizothecium vesticola]